MDVRLFGSSRSTDVFRQTRHFPAWPSRAARAHPPGFRPRGSPRRPPARPARPRRGRDLDRDKLISRAPPEPRLPESNPGRRRGPAPVGIYCSVAVRVRPAGRQAGAVSRGHCRPGACLLCEPDGWPRRWGSSSAPGGPADRRPTPCVSLDAWRTWRAEQSSAV